MQLGNPVGISLFANPVASPVMAPDPKSGWESADGHKRKERVRQEITIPHFVSTFGNVKYKRRVRGSFTAVLSTLNAPNYKLQPGRLHQVGRAGKESSCPVGMFKVEQAGDNLVRSEFVHATRHKTRK
ncbi:hypothetical protein FA13DRAFT_1717898 [Coprinellus micaceus]|nr:hypothetical protein FA13DRAFT_1717898 [Coprinellus micaceus]